MQRLNFDIYKIIWAFDWCDPRYKGWGSPSCPQETHSHRISKTGAHVERHYVDYGNHEWVSCLDCDAFIFLHQEGGTHMICDTCGQGKDEV